jgi:WD40 repeat protein
LVITTIRHDEVISELGGGDGRLTTLGDGLLTSRELTRPDVVTRTKTPSLFLTSNPHIAAEVGDRKTRFLDARTGKAIEIATTAKPIDVDVSPDGAVLAIATDGGITLHRNDGKVIATLASHGKVARFDPTSRLVVLTGGNSDVMIVDAQTGKELHQLPETRLANTYVAFSRNAPRLAIGVGNTVQLWEVDRDHRRRLSSVSSTIRGSFALSDDGSLLATGSVDGSIRITDAAGRLLDRLVGSQNSIVKVEFAGHDSRLLGISAGASPRVSLWDVRSDHRAPDEIAAFAAAHSVWKLNGVLLERAR